MPSLTNSSRNNIFATLGRVFVRRRWHWDTIFGNSTSNVKASNGVFANATANQWSPGYYVAEFNELLLLVVLSGVGTGGSLTNVKLQVQLLDPRTGLWGNLTAATFLVTATQTIAASGNTFVGIAYPVPANFGGMIRVGITCDSASTTDGNFEIRAMVKS